MPPGSDLGTMPHPAVVEGLGLPVAGGPPIGSTSSPAAEHAVADKGGEAVSRGGTGTSGKSPSGEETVAQPFVLSDGLAPVPAKLVARIRRGKFVNTAELLRDNLEALRRGSLLEPAATSSEHPRKCRREVPDLLSWVQCFGKYLAVIAESETPKPRMRQLLAYQTLIVREACRCGGRGWQAYDTMFRQQAAGNQDVDRSKLNPTLYSVTFLAQAGSGRNCVLCMESDHNTPKRGLLRPASLSTTVERPSGMQRTCLVSL